MKIYIVVFGRNCEGYVIHAAFSTKELAREYIDNHFKASHCDYSDIYEETIDSPE